MASRKDEKEALRAERIAREQAEAAVRMRRQRYGMAGGILVVAIVVAVVVAAVSSHRGHLVKPLPVSSNGKLSADLRSTDARVDALLAGIPQPGDDVLGRASAPVSIVEYGDLECSVCDMLALPSNLYASNGDPGTGTEDQIIARLVRTGQAKLIYRSLETASDESQPDEFTAQQVAAYAAGVQHKGWNFIELFYNEQGQEGSGYVTPAYLDGLARQIPGLNISEWKRDLNSAELRQQVEQENAEGTRVSAAAPDSQGTSTPTLKVQGSRGQTTLQPGLHTYGQVLAAVRSVR